MCRSPKTDHKSPILRALHRLPVESRVEWRLLLLIFKSLSNQAPSYRSNLFQLCVPSRQLRSSADIRLLRLP